MNVWDFIVKQHEGITVVLLIATVIASWCMVNSSEKSAKASIEANERSARLYRAETRPLIQVRPIDIKIRVKAEGDQDQMIDLIIEMVNFSGFPATEVKFDALILDTFLFEYFLAKRKALEIEGQTKSLSIRDKWLLDTYNNIVNQQAFSLAPRDVRQHKLTLGIGPSKEFLFEKNKFPPIAIRKQWKSENGYLFDEIEVYRILVTKEGKGESFTFISEESFKKLNLFPNIQ